MPAHFEYYAEPFSGAMWVYLKSNIFPVISYYNDANPFMANLFECCKHYREFIPYIEAVDPQDEDLFYRYKDEVIERFRGQNFTIPDFDLGRKYVYVATQVFSGIIKQNSKMVDLKGKYKPKLYSFLNRLKNKKIQNKLNKLEVSNSSYEDLINKADGEDTLLYFDPPYYGTENLYGFHTFNKDSHENLLNLLKTLKSRWILSYYEFDILQDMLPEDEWRWKRKEYKKASMASKGKSQSTGTEVLVMNF